MRGQRRTLTHARADQCARIRAKFLLLFNRSGDLFPITLGIRPIFGARRGLGSVFTAESILVSRLTCNSHGVVVLSARHPQALRLVLGCKLSLVYGNVFITLALRLPSFPPLSSNAVSSEDEL